MQSIYHAGQSHTQADGAKVWRTHSPFDSLAKIDNCRLENLAGDMRRTVYATAEPDTYFSIPAVCKIAGCRVKGYITSDSEGNLVFRHVYYS